MSLNPDLPDDFAALLRDYPRARPTLPEIYRETYLQEYRRNRGALGGALYAATALLESWMHRRVAAKQVPGALLEVGAGTLNHVRYELASHYDIVEPLPALYLNSKSQPRINQAFASIDDIPDTARYARIISVAVLEHVEDLPRIVARSALLLEEGGWFQAGIPAEGGLLWGLAWRTTTGIAYRKRTGLPYAPVMRHEHLNRAAEILAVVRYCFRTVTVAWFPLPYQHLSFYGYIEARAPDLARCEHLLATRAP